MELFYYSNNCHYQDLNQWLSCSILLTSDNTVLVKKKETINVEQEIQVSGLIIDEFGVPLAGASIVEKGTANGAQSDFDGRFTLNVSNPNTTIVISYIGFIVQEIGREINTTGSKSNDAAMQQVVVQMKNELEKIKEQVLNIL